MAKVALRSAKNECRESYRRKMKQVKKLTSIPLEYISILRIQNCGTDGYISDENLTRIHEEEKKTALNEFDKEQKLGNELHTWIFAHYRSILGKEIDSDLTCFTKTYATVLKENAHEQFMEIDVDYRMFMIDLGELAYVEPVLKENHDMLKQQAREEIKALFGGFAPEVESQFLQKCNDQLDNNFKTNLAVIEERERISREAQRERISREALSPHAHHMGNELCVII